MPWDSGNSTTEGEFKGLCLHQSSQLAPNVEGLASSTYAGKTHVNRGENLQWEPVSERALGGTASGGAVTWRGPPVPMETLPRP